MKTPPCNLGFIGCGQLMSAQHIQNAWRSTVCRVHTLCDIDAARLQAVAARYPPVRTTTDHRALLADPEVDLVVIAMDPGKHAALAIAAMEAGKDVYVEKPMGVSAAECRRVARVAARTGRRLTTGFNRRFAPAYLDIRPLLRPREGALKMFYRIADHERWERADLNRLLHEVVHIFDLLCFLAEAEPATVYACQGVHHNDNIVAITFADRSVAAILSTGRTGPVPKEHLEIHWDRRAVEVESFVEARCYGVPGAPPVKRYPGRIADDVQPPEVARAFAAPDGLERLRAILREEAARFDDHLAGRLTREQVVAASRGYVEEKGWAAALDEMASAILEGRRPANATATDGTRAVVMAEAANRSVATGRAVRLDPRRWTPGGNARKGKG